MVNIIYKIENKINGKIYIGFTSQPFKNRIAQHKYSAKKGAKHALAKAIRKYGWENFDKEIIYTLKENEKPDDIEIEYIKKYNSLANGGYGYNRTNGGGGILGFTFTEEQKKKISDGVRKSNFESGRKKHFLQLSLFPKLTGYKHTEESKKKISDSGKKRTRDQIFKKLLDGDFIDISWFKTKGLSYKKIGKIYDVKASTVFYYCKRNGI